MFENLERDNVNFSLSLVISPSSCTLLEDPVVQKQYLEWLDKKIELGKKEIERCSGNALLLNNAKKRLYRNSCNLCNFDFHAVLRRSGRNFKCAG